MSTETIGKAKTRVVEARRIIGKKHVKDKTYSYDYYTLSLNLYVPRNIVNKYGKEFVVVKEEETGIITIMPKKIAEEKGIKVE
ncbi:hypothetical protein QPL79_08045 [Ignisphaera sp. 4213-co]|uniref:AbrB/MazE/SpoVT family DNA-binding domain-containing protein n=1 Tax=Ignisphaera cupida TaxID=3050454 RepID=A0ABD4Z7I9_9CREN|nr:hypothetical protein [Ignisphaera sp. 4213-co]MDK6029311.1 hypothetical protein [Ignisphaera sp. 4213-co]